jgi:hypothetical protein
VSITSTFYERICANFFAPKKLKLYFKHKKAPQITLAQKSCSKMLVILTTGRVKRGGAVGPGDSFDPISILFVTSETRDFHKINTIF